MINNKTKKKVCGRLFYAIVRNLGKIVTFNFSKANVEEVSGVTCDLSLFTQDYFKLDPRFFCSSDVMASVLGGHWEYDKRTFLTAEKKMRRRNLTICITRSQMRGRYIYKKNSNVLCPWMGILWDLWNYV